MSVDLKAFWYIVAETHELRADVLLAREMLGEKLVCYRDVTGKATVLRDRCLHRCGMLSKGKVQGGELTCPYHGWVYAEEGKVTSIPSEGGEASAQKRQLKGHAFGVCEVEGYVYVCLEPSQHTPQAPHIMPHFQEKGWCTVRLQNRFGNTLTNCVENYIDIPHTGYVHPGVFRDVQHKPIQATVEQQEGRVKVVYQNEAKNLGWFGWFLNPKGLPIEHTDTFHMPNTTSAWYKLPSRGEYIITSQCVPIQSDETLVYTDITFNFGGWTRVSKGIVRHLAQKVIDQDKEILSQQMEVIKRYGGRFMNTQADKIHSLITEIMVLLERGEDPKTLPTRTCEVTFWV